MIVGILLNSWDDFGGVATVSRSLARGLSAAGHDVRRLSVWSSSGSSLLGDGSLPRRLVLRFARRWGLERKVGRMEVGLRATVIRNLKSQIPDAHGAVVIAMDVLASQLVARAGYRYTTTIGQFHSSYEALAKTSDHRRLILAGEKLSKVLMLTQCDAEDLVREAPGLDVGYIRNPSDLCGKQPFSLARTKRVVCLGRFSAEKNLELLLRAWARIYPTAPEWRLDLYGKGPQRKRLVKLVKRLEVADSVTIAPPVSNVGVLLASASLLALPSNFEGLPLVLLEAMSQGTPVVATDCSPGVRIIVRGRDTGWLAPVGDETGLVRALKKGMLLDEEWVTKSRNGLEWAAEYSVANVTRDWLSLIGSVQLPAS